MENPKQRGIVYMPDAMRDFIRLRGKKNDRSFSAEVRHLIRMALTVEGDPLPESAGDD